MCVCVGGQCMRVCMCACVYVCTGQVQLNCLHDICLSFYDFQHASIFNELPVRERERDRVKKRRIEQQELALAECGQLGICHKFVEIFLMPHSNEKHQLCMTILNSQEC